jgi:uncharacterized protein (TIGR01777 family)
MKSAVADFMEEVTMKIFMTGGTGFVGSILAPRLTQAGHEVTILTRKVREGQPLPSGVSYLEGNPAEKGAWQERAAAHDAAINLAGTSIFTRWSDSAKKAMRESRILTTENLVEALGARQDKKTALLSTSAVGYYGFSGDEELHEESPPGEGFLASLSEAWEQAALKAQDFGARVVLLRFGIVLGRHGGALVKMVPLFKWYIGSPLGSGKQWFSWIHEQDLADIFRFVLDHENLSGPVNCTAPHPVRNREMTTLLGKVLGKATFMPPVPGFMIKMVLGEFGSVLLKGQKVLPAKLLQAGFHFSFPEMKGALEDLLRE